MTKYRLILRDNKNFCEKDFCCFSYRYFYLLLVLAFIVVSVFDLFIFNTILSKWVNPFHYYKLSSQKVYSMCDTVSKLTEQVESNERYIGALQDIIKGNSKSKLDDILENKGQKKIGVQISNNGSMSKRNNVVSSKMPSLKENIALENLFPPVVSMNLSIVNSFSPNSSLTLQVDQPTPLCSIADGVVLFSDYQNNKEEVVTIIQHSYGIVSIYKYFGTTKLNQATKVSAGDVLCVLSKNSANNFVIELFVFGNRVNPEDYFNFYL